MRMVVPPACLAGGSLELAGVRGTLEVDATFETSLAAVG
jgi:hypothetical protein